MDGNLVRQLCDFATDSQDKIYTYHPSSSGLVERYNWTILQTIRCFRKSKQQDWDLWLQKLTRANGTTPNMQTYLPRNMMMFGKEAFQPFYVTLGTLKIDSPKKEVSHYIEDWWTTLGKFTKQQKRTLKQSRNGKMICTPKRTTKTYTLSEKWHTSEINLQWVDSQQSCKHFVKVFIS